MPTVLIAADAEYVIDEARAALAGPDTTLAFVRSGRLVRGAVAEMQPDLVVLDLQIGSMGAMAVALELHHEAGAGRMAAVPVLMLLDREADVFLARRSEAEGWIVKPLDAFRLRRAATALMSGSTWHEGVPEDLAPIPPDGLLTGSAEGLDADGPVDTEGDAASDAEAAGDGGSEAVAEQAAG